MTDVRPPVDDLDPALIGIILINMAAASSQLGHARVSSTMRNYFDVDEDDSDEARFVKAVFTERTPEIAERWYGGKWGVAEVVARATG